MRSRIQAKDKDWKDKVATIKSGVAQADKQVLKSGDYTYIGDTKDGKAHGWGIQFYPSGYMVRGNFQNGSEFGQIDILSADQDARTVATTYIPGSSAGVRYMPDGRIYKGNISQNTIPYGSGAMYRADGSIEAKGLFRNGDLDVGEIFDSTGNVISKIDKPREAMQAAEARQKVAYETQQREEAERRAVVERARLAQQAAEQRKQDETAAAERAYRASLNAMNAGQLFAKADELSSSGDSVKAREVLRSLVSRFPDHALAAQAAAQMAGGSSAGSQGANVNTQSSNGQRVGSAQKGMTCREATDEVGNNFILFFAPTDAAGKLSDADKLMQYVYVSKKLQQLVSQHPACRDNAYSKTVISGLESWQSQCRSARGSDCANGRDLVGYGPEADKIIARLLSTPVATNNSGDLQGQNCDRAIAKQEQEFEALNRKPVPPGGTPPLMRVMWMTSEKIKLIRANCPNTATYQSQIRDLQSVYDQSDKACGQMVAGNTCPGPNPYR